MNVSATNAVYTPIAFNTTYTNTKPFPLRKRVKPLVGTLIVDADPSAPLTRLEWKGEWYRRVTRKGRRHYFRQEAPR